MSNEYKVDPSNFLGIEHSEYKNEILALALSRPSEYYQLRKAVVKNMKTGFVTQAYDSFYNLLSTGSKTGASDASMAVNGGAAKDLFIPKLPKQEINQFALRAAKTLNAMVEEAIELVLPANHLDIAHKIERGKSEANMLNH